MLVQSADYLNTKKKINHSDVATVHYRSVGKFFTLPPLRGERKMGWLVRRRGEGGSASAGEKKGLWVGRAASGREEKGAGEKEAGVGMVRRAKSKPANHEAESESKYMLFIHLSLSSVIFVTLE